MTSFLACLSSTFWHKNRVHAIATFAALRSNGYDGHLVIAGPEPFYGRSTADEDALLASLPTDVRTKVHRLGAVDESAKWWLLTHADAALYPSVNEGFGLVPFEAANVGTPTLAGATASIPEVLGPDVQMATTWRPEDWAAILRSWIDDPVAAARQVDAIAVRGSELTWAVAAARTWDALDLTLARPRRQPPGQDGDVWSSMEAHRIGPTLPGQAVRATRRVLTFGERRLRSLWRS